MSERETYIQPLRQSSIASCLRCKRYYMFRDRWCIFLKRLPYQVAAGQGQVVHRFLQFGPEKQSQVEKEAQETIANLVEQVEKGEDLVGEIAARANKLGDQLDKAKLMVNLHWEKYPRPPQHKIIFKEKNFDANLSIPITDSDKLTIWLAGTLDEVVLNEESGLIWIRDYKTTSRDIAFTLTGYQFSLQCRIYRLLAGVALQDLEEYKNRKPEGFILDILRVPNISMCGADRDYKEYEHVFKRGPRKGETELRRDHFGEPKFENYLARCKDWYLEKDCESTRSFAIQFSEPILSDELANVLMFTAVHQMIPAVPANFGRDLTASYCKYMERVCPYYQLCQSDESAWDGIIEEKYEVVVPDLKLEPKDETKESNNGTDKASSGTA